MRGTVRGGIGIGWRRELGAALLAEPSRVAFVEVVAESCRDPATRREIMALAEVWPVVPHGVKLSLGSADGLDARRVDDFAKVARDLRAPVVSEHVSFVRAGGREIGHLTDLPRTREAVAVVARNVAALRARLGDIPLLLENVASTFVFDDGWHEMDEPDFYAEIVEATGCDLLLDVGNLHANAHNAGLSPRDVLARFPIERVGMLHVAGGVLEDGFYFDTHAHPVPDAVFDEVGMVRAARPDLPILLERDTDFDDVGAVLAEVERLRGVRGPALPFARAAAPPHASAGPGLLDAERALAAALTSDDPSPFDPRPLARARRVLQKKRADDALPLLPRLRERLSPSDALRLGGIEQTARPTALAAVLDAWRIADGAHAIDELRADAAEDRLVLRARWVRAAGAARGARPRAMPFVGHERLPSGGSIWVWKSLGADAPVRVLRGDHGN